MALGDLIGNLRTKVESAVNNFFYPDGEYIPQHGNVPQNMGDMPQMDQTPQVDPYMNGSYMPQAEPANPYEQQAYAQQNMHAQGAQNYQQPQQSPYQQPYQGNGYQQPQQSAYAQQNTYQPQHAAQSKPQTEGNVVYFPNQQNIPQQETPAFAARVINARSVSDCYSAISQLRAGDMVILVLENIADPTEMRHYVDMLSGACYSLRATITKLSRHGAYLICPTPVKVFVDAATNQLNSVSSRTAQRAPQPQFQSPNAYQAQQAAYQQPQAPYQQNMQDPYQRRVAPDAHQVPYYSRSVAPDPQMMATTEKQVYNGYRPDMPMENAQ